MANFKRMSSHAWPHWRNKEETRVKIKSSSVTRTDTLSASERAYQAFPLTRRITVHPYDE